MYLLSVLFFVSHFIMLSTSFIPSFLFYFSYLFYSVFSCSGCFFSIVFISFTLSFCNCYILFLFHLTYQSLPFCSLSYSKLFSFLNSKHIILSFSVTVTFFLVMVSLSFCLFFSQSISILISFCVILSGSLILFSSLFRSFFCHFYLLFTFHVPFFHQYSFFHFGESPSG